jgi:hypothetical protein
MSKKPLIVFDVNVTLLDLAGAQPNGAASPKAHNG